MPVHQRKALMADLADGFLALPGGYGTADELFEILTWAQLGLHAKPIGLLNVAGFFDPLLEWVDHCVSEGFLLPEHRETLLISANPAIAAAPVPAAARRWRRVKASRRYRASDEGTGAATRAASALSATAKSGRRRPRSGGGVS